MGRRRKRRTGGPSGILLVDKQVGPTSRETVADISRTLDISTAGHCGTLDPRASGLLVLVLGQGTRVQDILTGHDKVYRALITLGSRSVTDDGEGPLVPEENLPDVPGTTLVEATLKTFVGRSSQVPPSHSAIHVDGTRSWKLARQGEAVDLPPREIVVHSIELLHYAWPGVEIQVSCGPGTYIRSLARDIGEVLGTGAYLEELRRLQSGWFEAEDAHLPEDVSLDHVLSLEDALESLPRIDVDPGDLEHLLNGRELDVHQEIPEHGELLLWCESRVVGRGVKVGAERCRMKRMICDPRKDQG